MDITPKRLKSLDEAPMTGEAVDDDEDHDVNNVGIDRISNLPDEVLCHILSFIPTKKAVATSILSTRWQNLFSLIPNLKLELDDSLLLLPEKSSRDVIFTNFVDRLLNVTLRDTPSLQSFHLNLQKIDDGRQIGNWVTSALRLNAKKMDIKCSRLRNHMFFIDSLFGCNLVYLNLMLEFGAGGAPECRFNLPNVKMLCVQNMRYKVVNMVLEGCPSLEHLWVYNCYCPPGEKLSICIPSLKALKLISYSYFLEGIVEFDVPNLHFFNYCGFLASQYLGKKMRSLRVARLDLHQNVTLVPSHPSIPETELINLCSGAEKLWVSDYLTLMLHRFPERMPRFQKLLVFMMNNIDVRGWKLIPSLLESAPNLEALVVRFGIEYDRYELLKATMSRSLSISLQQRNDRCSVMQIERRVGN